MLGFLLVLSRLPFLGLNVGTIDGHALMGSKLSCIYILGGDIYTFLNVLLIFFKNFNKKVYINISLFITNTFFRCLMLDECLITHSHDVR